MNALWRHAFSWAFALTFFAFPSLSLAQPKDDQPKTSSVRLTKAPKAKKLVKAKYPNEALNKRIEGDVKLKLTISATGKVTRADVVQSPGEGLGDAAKKAALQFEFEPAEINNQPAAVTLTFTIKFELPVLPAKFTGLVQDSSTNKGLLGANIQLTSKGINPPVQKQQLSDSNGVFSFDKLPAGMYDVTLKVDAYQSFKTSIELVAGKTSEATYKVEAQPINFLGSVKEAGTRKLLPGIKIELQNPKDNSIVREGYTDAQGNFSFRGIPPGTYVARADAKGYIAASFNETIKANERTKAQYYVQSEYYDEFSASTTSRRAKREVSKQTLSLDEARRIPGTGGDVVRVVQNLPGVARASFGSGQLVVRGSNPQDSAVFLGGDELPLIYHFGAGPAVVNSEMIQAIDFYPGNFSAQYGRAIGGIIDLNTRSPRRDSVHGFTEIDLQDATAIIEVPITKDLSFALAGRRSYVDIFLNAILQNVPGANGTFVSPYYYDYQSWLTYTGFEDHKLELFVYGSSDRLEVLLPEAVGDENIQITSINQSTQFHRAQFRWEWTPNGPIKNTFMAALGRNDTSFSLGNLSFGTDQLAINMRDKLQLDMSSWLDLQMGLDMQLLGGQVKIDVPSFGQTDPGDAPNAASDGFQSTLDFSVLSPAFWAQLDFKPIEGMLISPGVRIDHYGTIANTSISPRLAGRWKFNKVFAVKGGVGLFTQPPDVQNTTEETGNPNLDPEKSIHYALGGEWRPLEYLELDITGFYKDTFSLVSDTSDFTIDEDTGEQLFTFFENKGRGRSYGAEFLLRHYPNNRFFGWIAYTLSRSERLNLDTDTWDIYEFDQTHILTAVAGYNLPWNVDISARFQYTTGNPYTPVVGSVFNADDDSYSQLQGKTNSARNTAFNQLDIRIDKKFVYDTWALGLFLDVQNVYNSANAEGVSRNFDFTESAPITGIPFFPSIGINAKF